MSFHCLKCGSCCRNVNKIAPFLDENLKFPYKWDKTGKCEKLTSNNKCSIYNDRPLICNVARMQKLINIPKKEFYRLNSDACNKLRSKDI